MASDIGDYQSVLYDNSTDAYVPCTPTKTAVLSFISDVTAPDITVTYICSPGWVTMYIPEFSGTVVIGQSIGMVGLPEEVKPLYLPGQQHMIGPMAIQDGNERRLGMVFRIPGGELCISAGPHSNIGFTVDGTFIVQGGYITYRV